MRPRRPSETEIYSRIFYFAKVFPFLQLVGLIGIYNLWKFWINSSQIKISTYFCIKDIFRFFRSFWNKTGFFSCFHMHFCLFQFILKQICLFQLFWYTSETPKQTKTKFVLVSKMSRNKRKTDHVSVIFGSNRNFFYSFRGHATHIQYYLSKFFYTSYCSRFYLSSWYKASHSACFTPAWCPFRTR